MAEDPKIIPSPPPAEPQDVQVSPSPPPREPFEVKVTPSPPPWEPFDVPITLDPPPAAPFDVPVNPDGPPGGTFDVPTTPSGPPSEPFQVPTNPDPPPASPTDVPITPDLPPLDPFDVPVTPDLPPLDPFDVPVTPDLPPADPLNVDVEPTLPPAEPFDVETEPNAPPLEPFDVEVTPSTPPAEAVLVRDHRPGVPPLPYPLSEHPSTRELVNAVKDYDRQLANFLAGLDDFDIIGESSTLTPYGGALNPAVLANWFKTYLTAVGSGGIARFLAEQGALYAMNVVGRVFNPAYFVAMLVPGSMGHFPAAVDIAAGNTAKELAENKDRVLVSAVRSNPNRPAGNGQSDRPDVYGPENTRADGADFTVDEMVDTILKDGAHPLLKTHSDGTQRFDASKHFDNSGQWRSSIKERAAMRHQRVNESIQNNNALDGIIRISVKGEDDDGVVGTDSQNSLENVSEDETRVPLSFTDLRRDPSSNKFRSVFFRPMNLTIAESISPQYGETNSFGRVDPMVSYSSTTRAFSIGFEQHAFAPEDLELMYKKITALKSMCYPSYGADSLMKSGPVVRMRIGDVVATEEGGLGGVIRNLTIDYNDALWELKHGMKVPRSFKVTLEFLALHDGPVGILDGYFGVLRLPPAGKGGTTNFAENTEPQDAEPYVATNQFGMFSRFGERRK